MFYVADGYQTVTRRIIVMTSASAKRAYNGTALVRYAQEDITVAGNGFVPGEGAVYTITGSQTLVGESANTFTYQLAEGTRPENYLISTREGRLRVTGDPFEAQKTTPEVSEDYRLGELIPFTITVKNVSDKMLRGVRIEDASATLLGGDGYRLESGAAVADIPAGEQITVRAVHKVTSEDILAGFCMNEAYVRWDDIRKTVTAQTDRIEPVSTDLTVKKTVIGKPANGKAYVLGEAVSYRIEVTNAGNVPYKNVKILDTLTEAEWIIDLLAVGETQTFSTTYIVTPEDLLAGMVHNVVTAAGSAVPDPSDPKHPKTPRNQHSRKRGSIRGGRDDRLSDRRHEQRKCALHQCDRTGSAYGRPLDH